MNYLRIPAYKYGTTGVMTGNVIARSLYRMGLKPYTYNSETQSIVIAKSLAFTQEQVQSHLDKIGYDGWRPYIPNERDKNGNLQIMMMSIWQPKNCWICRLRCVCSNESGSQ